MERDPLTDSTARRVGDEPAQRLTTGTDLVDVAAAVAHEVANAVGAIAGWAELGSSEHSGVDPRKALALISSCARSAEQAARLMLRLSRGEPEKPDDDPLDVSEVTGELLQLLSLTARQGRVGLAHQVEPGLCVRAGRGQWFSVLWNLVKNAIEASPASSQVSVLLYGDDDAVHLEVRDQGPGLDAAAQARVFTPYYTSKTQGTGLGLPLVQQTVRALGGRLELTSSLGAGCRFRVSVPRLLRRSAITSAPDEAPVRSDAVPTGLSVLDARVLVVDDDDALREMVATALSLRGARVVSARSGADALKVEGAFDIALVDMTLQDCRGDELLAHLRQQGAVHAAMLVTGTAQPPKLIPGGEPDDWLRKPFEISQLVDRVRRTLERHRMLRAAVGAHR